MQQNFITCGSEISFFKLVSISHLFFWKVLWREEGIPVFLSLVGK